MSNKKEQFKDFEYRTSYAESFLDTSIATQIRVLREQRGWTQGQLAERAGMKQSRISALEDSNYSRWGTTTLKRLARAFDVPLSITFGSYGRLVTDVEQFNRQALERPAFDQDPAFSAAITAGRGLHGGEIMTDAGLRARAEVAQGQPASKEPEQGQAQWPCGCARKYCPTHRPAYVAQPGAASTEVKS